MAVFQHRRRIPLWLQKHLCGPGCFSRDSRGSGGFSGLIEESDPAPVPTELEIVLKEITELKERASAVVLAAIELAELF